MTHKCEICGEGHTHQQTVHLEYQYKNHGCKVQTVMRVCDHCGSEFTGPEENRLNKRAMMNFRKRADGLLTGQQIRDIRAKYKLTQDQAARLFGGGPVAFSKYENDDVAQSEAMDTLLRVVNRSSAAFMALVEEKDMRAELANGDGSIVPYNAKRDQAKPGRHER